MRLLLLVSLFFLGQVSAAELRILSAGAVESGLHPVLAAFEKRTGHHVWSEVEPKATRYADGVGVFDHVLKGKGREIGFGASTEIMSYRDKGLVFAGPIPAEVQNYTSYVASAMSAGANVALARDLVAFLGNAESKKMFTAAGIE